MKMIRSHLLGVPILAVCPRNWAVRGTQRTVVPPPKLNRQSRRIFLSWYRYRPIWLICCIVGLYWYFWRLFGFGWYLVVISWDIQTLSQTSKSWFYPKNREWGNYPWLLILLIIIPETPSPYVKRTSKWSFPRNLCGTTYPHTSQLQASRIQEPVASRREKCGVFLQTMFQPRGTEEVLLMGKKQVK